MHPVKARGLAEQSLTGPAQSVSSVAPEEGVGIHKQAPDHTRISSAWKLWTGSTAILHCNATGRQTAPEGSLLGPTSVTAVVFQASFASHETSLQASFASLETSLQASCAHSKHRSRHPVPPSVEPSANGGPRREPNHP